jgi:hypothetical protein
MTRVTRAHRVENITNPAIPVVMVRGSRLAAHATVCPAAGDLEACWNRILAIFDPWTFSHTQGQVRKDAVPLDQDRTTPVT